mmetsp:Transcript_59170/g.137780  ORF Transcript_59170/g.137780 Transcript_59170/m.137780 type:complete len:186 (+) Transcript_59170:383-940(+)
MHRLDRETSGALLWARGYGSYYEARLQFISRRVRKVYLCLCHGWPLPQHRFIEAPLEEERGRSAVSANGRPALTELSTVAHLQNAGGEVSLVRILLHTGRQHQIRAHLAADGHGLVGDVAYGGKTEDWCGRTALHASSVALLMGEGLCEATVPLAPDLASAVSTLQPLDACGRCELLRTQGSGWC